MIERGFCCHDIPFYESGGYLSPVVGLVTRGVVSLNMVRLPIAGVSSVRCLASLPVLISAI